MMIGSLALAALLTWQSSNPPSNPPSNPTIRGTVVNATTHVPIADARVTLTEASLTTRTGPDGRFEFARVAPRTYTLTVSTIGYIFVRRRVVALANTNLELVVPLAEGTGTYQETVTVARPEVTPPSAIGVSSQMELGSAGLADLRGVAFDDPMRAVQALPGVATGNDFQAEFSVRGSAFRHVGVVMDGAPTQLLLHAVRGVNESGSVAMINTDVVSRAALFGGPHARPHGDWLGATLEFDVRDGSRDRVGARAAISGTSASGVFEGPLGSRQRGSWLVSVRRSYLDWLVRKVAPETDSAVGFTDAQAKLVYDLTTRHQLQFLAIAGDATYQQPDASPTNGLLTAQTRSVLGSLGWRFANTRMVLTQRLTMVQNDFVNKGVAGQHLAEGDTRLAIWRGEAMMPIGRGWTLEGGARREHQSSHETLRTFTSAGPGGLRVRFERSVSASPATTSGWGQVSWRNDRSGITAGARVTDRSGTAAAVLPWALAEHTIGTTTIRGGIGRSAQFLDPLMVIAPPVVTEPVPEAAWSADLSVEQPIGHGVRVQVTGFSRRDEDIVRRVGEDHVDPITGMRVPETPFPVFAPTLDGRSYGAEVLLIRRAPNGLSGWVGYTWAHTRYHDRATGESFDGDFDQRHTLNVFAQQRLSYRMTMNVKLRVGSNFPIVGYFAGEPDALTLSTLRNQVRLPVYARLDVRVNRTFTFARSRLTLFVEVMNLLGRDNLRQADGTIRPNLDAVGFVDRLLPLVPSAGLLFEF